MSQYDNSNSFVLFKNDKGDNPNRPDYTGTITLEDGTEKRLAAWIKEGKKGKFMAGKVSEKQPSQPQTVPVDDDPESDIPF
jgi:hypothetical protein